MFSQGTYFIFGFFGTGATQKKRLLREPKDRPAWPGGRKETSDMRHAFLLLSASALLAVFAGCACNNCCCNSSSSGNAGGVRQAAPQQQQPQGGTVSYPYYTTRGPRDFLETNPQSIGP